MDSIGPIEVKEILTTGRDQLSASPDFLSRESPPRGPPMEKCIGERPGPKPKWAHLVADCVDVAAPQRHAMTAQVAQPQLFSNISTTVRGRYR